MQNSIQLPDDRCLICLEGYGTLSRESGTIEVAIQLPCSHTVGSACIATWLKTNNTCPVCRHEFFPAQPRPYLEHGIMDDDEERDDFDDDEEHEEHEESDDDEDREAIRELNGDYCAQLGLDLGIAMVSDVIFHNLSRSLHLSEGHNNHCLVSVSIYIASHLIHAPRSPREIAAVTDVQADHIRFTFDNIFPHRWDLVNASFIQMMQDAFGRTGPLDWPATGYEVTDEQIESRFAAEALKVPCFRGCNELGLDVIVAEFSTRVAVKLDAGDYMSVFSSKVVAAVSILVACHMAGSPVPLKRIAEAVDATEVAVRSAYDVASFHRRQFLEQLWIEDDGIGSLDRALERLPSPSSAFS